MEDIFTKEQINDTKNMANKIEELAKEDNLKKYSPMGKNSNVLMQFDTGLGMTVKDLARKHPKIYRMLVNYKSIVGDVLDLLSGA